MNSFITPEDQISILIPCYNEEQTIAKVIEDFHDYLPEANIYVYNNNSTDRSVEEIEKTGHATLFNVSMQGKGAVVRQMFDDVNNGILQGTIFLMTDADCTYLAKDAWKLIQAVEEGADMSIGDRLSSSYFEENKRPFHGIGNNLVRFLVNKLYHGDIKDIMTGYRGFSKKFIKSVSVKKDGFEIETEMTIKALKQGLKIKAVLIDYKDRPDGSKSKLNTLSDGKKVLCTIFEEYRLWIKEKRLERRNRKCQET